MELKVPYPKPGISSSDYVSDPEDKDISDDEDDDRNHKHRRRETRSQSLERDSREQVLRSYGKHNKPFENGRSLRENESQASEAWNSGKFDKRRLGVMPTPRLAGDFNMRNRVNQTFSGDLNLGRGRGRESSTWTQFDSRFSPIDMASQLIHHGSFAPTLFAGRGLPSVSTAQNAPWSAFGLIPGIPNSGLDTMHSIGLQGTLRPPINPPLNIGLPRQRCRDFEERGFCLRGDMCPMEHGINRIVVEDVQSLSQFNLPLSLPNAHIMGKATGSLPAVSTSATTMMSGKGLLGKNSKVDLGDDNVCFNGVYSSSGCVAEADLYDPDQPLWNKNCPEKPNALSAAHSSKVDEVETLMNEDPSDRQQGRKCDSADNECPNRNTTSGAHVTNPSVWGRVGSGSRNRQDGKGKIDPPVSSSGYVENEMKEHNEVVTSVQGNSQQRKRNAPDQPHSKAGDLSLNTQSGTIRNMRKPSQLATRTLFVNGIPQQSNKRETLLSHFKKFGEVIDIYIPANGQRAFVQFSKTEEAEAALMSPDAVMGNRFIKLWWANRDNIPNDRGSNNNGIHVPPCHIAAASPPSLAIKGKNGGQIPTSKAIVSHLSDSSLTALDHSQAFNSPKVSPGKKKLGNLEQLKEELRKKQEMLAMKRNDFRRQLEKLEKQATGNKAEAVTEQASKRLKVGMATDVSSPKVSNSGNAWVSSHMEVNGVNVDGPCPEPTTSMVQMESSRLEQPVHPLAPAGSPFHIDKDKLDHCTAGFRIIPPLPAEFANVDQMKEHFSSFGDVSTVKLHSEDGGCDPNTLSTRSANVTFLTRHSAERAFADGKCWQGHTLKFIWLSGHDGTTENSPSTLEASPDIEMGPANEQENNVVFEETARDGECEDSTRRYGEQENKNIFEETPGDVEPQNSTRDNGVELPGTGKVSPIREESS